MSDASMASQIASHTRAATASGARSVREAVKPQNAGKTNEANSVMDAASVAFDATGALSQGSGVSKTPKSSGGGLNILA